MFAGRALSVAALVAIVGSMILSGVGTPGLGAPAPSGNRPAPVSPSVRASAPASPASTGIAGRVSTLEAELRAAHVPGEYVHLPDFLAATPGRVGPVTPTYASAPAPMGVADLGLENDSGTIVPTVLSTDQVVGTAAFDSADSVYLDGDGPNMFGVQLNAVATGVTVHGTTTDQYWAQDFLSYTPDNGTLTLGDNLWNFSNPVAALPASTIYAHGPNGTLVAPVYYYAVGPTFTVHYPFSVTFSLETGIVDKRPAIFFNYTVNSTVAGHAVSEHGSFDDVVFASARFPLFNAARPVFQANGTADGPSGLPNDFELVLVGDGDGDTTTFVGLNAQFTLSTWNGTTLTLQKVPAAYDAGSDTGETSDGVGVFFNATAGGTPSPVALLELGPSYLGGLWGLGGTTGYRLLSATLTPTNAFVFATPGTTYRPSLAQWAPTLAQLASAAATTIAYPNGGAYNFDFQLSDYRPIHRTIDPAANSTAHLTVTMTRANGDGIYTPLLVWGDSELPYVTSAGNGSAANPYVLESNQPKPIDPIYGAVNDYLFPVFPGVMLVDTNATVRLTPSSLLIDYSAGEAANLSAVGLPSTNHLQIELWNVTNASLLGDGSITGWLSAYVGFSPVGAVIVWGSHGDLVAENTFYDEGVSLALYGGTGNIVWGNSFLNSTAPATNQSMVLNSGNNTTGVWESESGDLIYNDYFALPAPAYTPTIDPVSCEVSCVGAAFTDLWNVSEQPATDYQIVLGTNLTGSIIGTSYQGGSYWSNYGTPADPYGVLPYTDGGRIAHGGDFVPLVRTVTYPVAVNAHGLAAGVAWGIDVGGTEYRTNQSELTIYLPNGSWTYLVDVPVGYTGPANGTVTVNGTGAAVTVVFTRLLAETFSESGLYPGWAWNVTVYLLGNDTNQTFASTNRSLTVELVPGLYGFWANASGYNATPATGSAQASPTNATPWPTIAFSLTPILSFSESGLAPGTAWTVTVGAGAAEENYSSSGPGLVLDQFELPVTAYEWTAGAANYTVSPSSGREAAGEVSTYRLTFVAVPGTLSGTVSVGTAEVFVDGSLVSVVDGAFSLSETPGLYAVAAVAPGYYSYFNNVSVTSATSTHVGIVLVAIPAAAKSTSSGPAGISDLGWVLIALLAVVAVAAIGYAVLGRRRPRAPAPVAPYAGTAPAAAPAAAPPPWQEEPGDTSVPPPSPPPR